MPQDHTATHVPPIFCYCICNRLTRDARHVSPALIQMEAQIIADATERGVWDEFGDMSVRASASSRQAS